MVGIMICQHCGTDLREIGITEVHIHAYRYQGLRYDATSQSWETTRYEAFSAGEWLAYRCGGCFADVTDEQAAAIAENGG